MLLTSFFKDLPRLLAVFSLVVGTAWAVATQIEPTYRAESLLYVRYGREYAYRADRDGEIAQTFETKEIMRAEARMLETVDLATTVIDRLGMQTIYPDLLDPSSKQDPHDAAVQRLSEEVKAQAGEHGNIITVTFEHADAVVATHVLDAWVEAYLAERKHLFAEGRGKALAPEVDAARARLTSLERRYQAMREHPTQDVGAWSSNDNSQNELASVERDLELADAAYRDIAKRFEEARLLDQVAAHDAANVRILQPARLDPAPHDLRPMVLGLGTIAGLLAALIVGLLSDLLRRGYLTPEELEASTGLPVLASLPLRRQPPWRGRQTMRLAGDRMKGDSAP